MKDKVIIIGFVIVSLIFLVMNVLVYRQHLAVQKLAGNVDSLAISLEELDAAVASLYQDMQDMKYDIKEINKTLDVILRELWLSRPPVPEDHRPIPVKEE